MHRSFVTPTGVSCAAEDGIAEGAFAFLRRLRFRKTAERLPAALETKSADRDDAAVLLNERELDVLNWVASGKSDWQVAQILSVSPKTVNYHVENAKRKLRATSRIQAVVEAVRLGLIDGRAEE